MPPRLLPLERPEFADTLTTVRNMWEFCAFVQFLSFFSAMLKIETEFGVEAEVVEEDLMGVNDPTLCIGEAHRAMVHLLLDARFRSGDLDRDTWKVYQRRSKKLGVDTTGGLFGEHNEETDEYEHRFQGLDAPDKVRVLAQLAQWTAAEDRFREKLDQASNAQEDYRIGPVGYSGDNGRYFLFDDNRLYYKEDFEPDLADAELPEEEKAALAAAAAAAARKKKKAKSKRSSRHARRRSRRLVEEQEEEEVEEEGMEDGGDQSRNGIDENGDAKVPLKEALAREYEPVWRCVAWDMASWEAVMDELRRSKDPDEKALYKYLSKGVLDVIREADLQKKQAALAREKARELAVQVAHRKTSTRLAQKRMREQEDPGSNSSRHASPLERDYDDEDARRMQRRRLRVLEDEREKRVQGWLAREEKRKAALASAGTRRSTRTQKAEEEKWYFDCICGVHGENFDDGTMSVACEQCNIWMHVACQTQEEQDAINEDGIDFICYRCRRIEEARRKEELRRQRAEEQARLKQEELARRRQQAAERKRQREEERRRAAEEERQRLAAAAPAAPAVLSYGQPQPQFGQLPSLGSHVNGGPNVPSNGGPPGPWMGTFNARPEIKHEPAQDPHRGPQNYTPAQPSLHAQYAGQPGVQPGQQSGHQPSQQPSQQRSPQIQQSYQQPYRQWPPPQPPHIQSHVQQPQQPPQQPPRQPSRALPPMRAPYENSTSHRSDPQGIQSPQRSQPTQPRPAAMSIQGVLDGPTKPSIPGQGQKQLDPVSGQSRASEPNPKPPILSQNQTHPVSVPGSVAAFSPNTTHAEPGLPPAGSERRPSGTPSHTQPQAGAQAEAHSPTQAPSHGPLDPQSQRALQAPQTDAGQARPDSTSQSQVKPEAPGSNLSQ